MLNSYLLGIVASILTIIVVIDLLRRRKLRERHAIWWLLAGVVSLTLSLFPQVLVSLTRLLGIEIPSNFIFFLSILVLFMVCLQQSAELTKLEENQRSLAEEIAKINFRIPQ